MSWRLKLLKRLHDVNLSPEEAERFLNRLQNYQASDQDRDRLAQVICTTTQVSDALLAKASRRRNRR